QAEKCQRRTEPPGISPRRFPEALSLALQRALSHEAVPRPQSEPRCRRRPPLDALANAGNTDVVATRPSVATRAASRAAYVCDEVRQDLHLLLKEAFLVNGAALSATGHGLRQHPADMDELPFADAHAAEKRLAGRRPNDVFRLRRGEQ